MLELQHRAASLLVLDHHKTAEEDLAGLDFARFDMEHSGARLAWDHYVGKLADVWWLVDYVEDRDLWRWALPESKAVNATIQSWPETLEAWDELAKLPITDAVSQGLAILRYQATIVEKLSQKPQEVMLGGYAVLTVNAPVLQSEVCEKLAQGRAFGACWFETDGKRVWSLRSREPSDVDVSKIAKAFGGGGHARAAGFTEGV
jgi:nanoRNase/pAp phosphatase (c-di-AMP/oligoRNAs hydrolase)